MNEALKWFGTHYCCAVLVEAILEFLRRIGLSDFLDEFVRNKDTKKMRPRFGTQHFFPPK